MSDKKPESWGSSFDHVVFWGVCAGARMLQADREAKFENKYGRNRPHEQQPQHQGGAGDISAGKDWKTGGEDSTPVELVDDGISPQREEHGDTVELLQDVARELENQQQLDQQKQDLELPTDNDQHSDEGGSSGARTPPGSPPLAPPPRVECDDEDMAGTKIRIPKFTGARDRCQQQGQSPSPSPKSPSASVSGRGDVVSFDGRWCPTQFPMDRIRPARLRGSRKSWRMTTGPAAGCSHRLSTFATSSRRGGSPGHAGGSFEHLPAPHPESEGDNP